MKSRKRFPVLVGFANCGVVGFGGAGFESIVCWVVSFSIMSINSVICLFPTRYNWKLVFLNLIARNYCFRRDFWAANTGEQVDVGIPRNMWFNCCTCDANIRLIVFRSTDRVKLTVMFWLRGWSGYRTSGTLFGDSRKRISDRAQLLYFSLKMIYTNRRNSRIHVVGTSFTILALSLKQILS